ncbi:MAG: methyltransferase domain-containing protein, partial [Halobacteriota archaeon]
MEKGPDADVVCDAENLMDIFPEESFDVVFSTDLLEHAAHHTFDGSADLPC